MKTATLLAIILFPIILTAQEIKLYENINYQNAIKKGTRSRDGKPGLNYWQNHADYDIEVRLDTTDKRLYGKETIVYHNNSPDTITQIVLRFYQNKYKKGAIRNSELKESNLHGGVKLDTLKINGKGMNLNPPTTWTNGTNLLVNLSDSIFPKERIKLYCEWDYRIPFEEEYRRHGYYKDNAWFIGYFYPQIAVYDDIERFYGIKGWDLKTFHEGALEFYNDFNNYNVKIIVPDGFFVWATGELVNPEKVYKPALLERIQEAQSSNETIQITAKDDNYKDLLSGNEWEFRAEKVPDFGFGTALNYVWDATSVDLGDKRVFVDIAYHPESTLYPMAIEVARKSVLYASEKFPGIEYPYSHTTTFNGIHGGGMEFPMIANNSDVKDTASFINMTFHEIFHNYMPFMMGINEKKYPFIDEGLNEFFSEHFLMETYGMDMYMDNSMYAQFGGIMGVYNFYAKNEDFPLMNSYSQVDKFNLFYLYYIKPAVAFTLFSEMIGREHFLKAFKTFVERWEGKHPTAYDLFYNFNDALNMNYNWFWKAWFFDLGYPDLGIKIEKGEIIVYRAGEGSLPLPIHLDIQYKDGTSTSISKAMDVWKNGDKEVKVDVKNIQDIESIIINTERIPDINHENNRLDF